ncbi:MAG TPA: RpiB/LacA/LacB family sugar-phosphate isomerase [Oligoflexia bacterium]|nr:RpiB/LacA/LacB family sugar-phosphate isomerase [Oligoflexia bacterium]HMP49128.1 RpiB/LacA/LacB family sugar-phosphate isomerase [Oligoflexia bacterium]
MSTRVAISSDHAGFDLKEKIKLHFPNTSWLDLGTFAIDSVDYPDFGYKIAQAIQSNEVYKAVAICGSGIGMSIAVNRFPEVRGALCLNSTMARLAREHVDSNVLVLSSQLVEPNISFDCVNTFLKTKFYGGRHLVRLEKLNALKLKQ